MNRQTLFGTFGLLTLILAGAAVARSLGLPLDAAFYLSAASIVACGYLRYHYALR